MAADTLTSPQEIALSHCRAALKLLAGLRGDEITEENLDCYRETILGLVRTLKKTTETGVDDPKDHLIFATQLLVVAEASLWDFCATEAPAPHIEDLRDTLRLAIRCLDQFLSSQPTADAGEAEALVTA